MKGYVARHNTTYKLPDVKQLTEKAVNETTADNWRHCIQHIMKEEDKLWQLAHIIDIVIVDNNADSSNTSSYTDMDFTDSN